MNRPRNYAAIEMTKEECHAIAEMAEFFVSQRALYIQTRVVAPTNHTVNTMISAANRVKMKASVAASALAPEIIIQ